MEVLELFVFVFLCGVTGERILAVFPLPGKSHFFVYEAILAELANRGHDVTVISPFPRARKLHGYTDIDVSNHVGNDFMFAISGLSINAQGKEKVNELFAGFEKVFYDKRIEELLNSTKFDLIMTEVFLTDMFVGIAHKFDIPLVEMISCVPYPWATDRFAIPDNPSYIRTSDDQGIGPMSFYERLRNTAQMVGGKLFYYFVITRSDDKIISEYVGRGVPHVTELMKRASLLLVNSHFSLSGARPYPPQVVEIGGVHIKPATPLPQEIDKFINESEHGVVYFSLGSVANASSMPEETRIAFINSFAKLKQRVLWKWELDEMPGKPENVKIVKWMPQRDVLAHPNVRAFMSHGGLLGTAEGVYNAVPMIGIPVFGDQFQNIYNLVNAGSAVLLDLEHITEDSVTKALTAVLEDPNYKKNAERLSQLFRDRPASPLDTAVFWIEYVMRHKGAYHLRSAAVDLPWYQYLLLDVIAFLLAILVLVVLIITKTVKLILKKISTKRKQKKN